MFILLLHSQSYFRQHTKCQSSLHIEMETLTPHLMRSHESFVTCADKDTDLVIAWCWHWLASLTSDNVRGCSCDSWLLTGARDWLGPGTTLLTRPGLAVLYSVLPPLLTPRSLLTALIIVSATHHQQGSSGKDCPVFVSEEKGWLITVVSLHNHHIIIKQCKLQKPIFSDCWWFWCRAPLLPMIITLMILARHWTNSVLHPTKEGQFPRDPIFFGKIPIF